MNRKILGALLAASALIAPAAAHATSVVRVQWEQFAFANDTARGSSANATGRAYGAQVLTVNGSTQSTATSPGFGSTYGGFARLEALSGAVVCTFDGSTPSDSNGVRVDPSNQSYQAVSSGAVMSCVESSNQPTGGASSVTVTPASAPSGVTPVTSTFTATGQSASFTPVGGRGFNVSIQGTFVGTVQLERFLNGTWQVLTASAAGTTTLLYVFSTTASETVPEPQSAVPYRLNCTAYSSGTISYSLSQ